MICPKCEKGTLMSVMTKKDNRPASLCDMCKTLWFAGETIDFNTGHVAATLSEDELEFTIAESSERDQEHRTAEYGGFK